MGTNDNLRLELALSLALICLENSEPGSPNRIAAEAIRSVINSKFFPPRHPGQRVRLVVDNGEAL